MIILLVNEFYAPYIKGGAEISTQILAESLVLLGHEVHICTSYFENVDETVNGVQIHRRKQHNLYWSWDKDRKSAWQKIIWHSIEGFNPILNNDLCDMVDLIKPDIIHTNVFTGFSIGIWRLAKKKHIPVIHTLRDFYLMCIKSTMFSNEINCKSQCVSCILFSLIKKYYSNNVNGVVGISRYMLDTHLNKGYFKNSQCNFVIPNSVNFKFQSTDKDSRIIGYLGRIHKSKGIEYLIDNFLLLPENNFVLHIAGDGEFQYINYLISKYQSKKIRFVGKVSAESFLSNIQLLVVPSLWNEPFGRVVVEALSCGCPVFVSNRGGMTELVSKTNGKVFKLEEKDSLFKLLSSFINNKLHFEIDIREINSLYSPINIGHMYESAYKEVINCY